MFDTTELASWKGKKGFSLKKQPMSVIYLALGQVPKKIGDRIKKTATEMMVRLWTQTDPVLAETSVQQGFRQAADDS